MAAIANVAITDTFQIWLTRTNQTLSRLNEFAIKDSVLYANTVNANNVLTIRGQDSDAKYANTLNFGNLQANTNNWINSNLANTNHFVLEQLSVANAVAIYAELNDGVHTGNTTFDTDTLIVDGTADKVSVNSAIGATALTIGGKITANPTEILTIANSSGSVVKTINGFTAT